VRWFFKRERRTIKIPLIELIMQAQSDMARQQAKFMLDKRGLYLRIDRQLRFPMTLDELDKVNLLSAYADLTAEEHQALAEMFL